MAGEPAFKGSTEEWFELQGHFRHEVARIDRYVLSRRDGLAGFSIEDSRHTGPRPRIVDFFQSANFGAGWKVYGRGWLESRTFQDPVEAFEWWFAQLDG